MGAIIGLLKQVLGSWQVLFITAAIIAYFSLVSYVAKLNHRARSPRRQGSKRKKAAETVIPGENSEAAADSGGADDVILEE
jgi:hypothetical protein